MVRTSQTRPSSDFLFLNMFRPLGVFFLCMVLLPGKDSRGGICIFQTYTDLYYNMI